VAYRLRTSIVSQKDGRLVQSLESAEEREIASCVEQYMKAYDNLRTFISTPYVFPLLQMSRTFLFFWTFTLPFALMDDYDNAVFVYVVIFLITYGFIGLECVIMELDDPFGDDPCDFEDLKMAQMVFEDIYTTIWKVDGFEAAEELRDKVAQRAKKGSPLDTFHEENADLYVI